ncbi:MAG: C-terminal target protein [Flaviaesturariibacter sp.]|nr:C-terminal target protein [Flaviaesturariibacter sp.]
MTTNEGCRNLGNKPITMKQKILLLAIMAPLFATVFAQKKTASTAYAITGGEKGASDWTEVRLVDVNSGAEVKTIYQNAQTVRVLNARTGKDVQATEASTKAGLDKPFATLSAACAYDKKHERLYYTPMGINQLRYIDLKGKEPKVYYFEGEPFGIVSSRRDVPNQVTRMVIASDGKGYALTNNANHLIQFTTGKKPVITDLGPVSDDASNDVSIHDGGGYGGDMIADAAGNLYLVNANRGVYKIALDSRTATYIGFIRGLPRGFSTNGAVAEGGSTVIVSSSSSTQGYYRFDLNTLKAEKIEGGGPVFNASDLANGTLAFEKKKKDTPQAPAEVKNEDARTIVQANPAVPDVARNSISVFPNPVTNGVVKVSFADQPMGRYQVQLLDLGGKLISTREVSIGGKTQLEEIVIPDGLARGSYVVKVTGVTSRSSFSTKIVVQ